MPLFSRSGSVPCAFRTALAQAVLTLFTRRPAAYPEHLGLTGCTVTQLAEHFDMTLERVESLVPEPTKRFDGRADGIQRLWVEPAPVKASFVRRREKVRVFQDTDVL